uniref:Uncharacterized protein DKFZp781G0119-like n=1 Tax=Haemonchus contortus TaxID=6289 RepID=W6NBH9_HAECO
MYKLCSVDLENCRVLHLEINQRVDGRSASPHGVQQKMCRDFLHEFASSGTLISPQRSLKEIMVVGRDDFVSNSATKFQQWLRKQSVTVKSINRADSVSLEDCLRYSLVVWVESHQYYRCGKALLKGPFLEGNPYNLTRIWFVVHCTSSGEVFLRISPETVRLFPLESKHIRDSATEPRWVYCLPKLGRGQLVGRYRNIPEDSAFANYAQMRAYWKNCHGYDLPLTEPKNYYNVCFNGIRSSFLYPDFCVLSSEPQPIGFLEEQKTALVAVEEFSRSFFSEEHFICGERCKFIPSKSEFVRSHGPTSIDTAPLTGRRTLSGPNVRSDGHGSVVSKQLQQNGTQKNEEVSSPTKRLAGAFTKSLCQEALASPPVHMNSSKAKTIVKEARLFTSSNVKEKDEKHHVQQYLPTGSQCFSQTIRSRKRCVDVE